MGGVSDAGRCSLKVARLVAFPSPKIVTSFAAVADYDKSNALRFVFRFVSKVEKFNCKISLQSIFGSNYLDVSM